MKININKVNNFLVALALASNYVSICIYAITGITTYTIIAFFVFVISIIIRDEINKQIVYIIFISSLLPVFSVVILKEIECIIFLEYFIQSLLFAWCITIKFDFYCVCKNIVYIYIILFWGMLLHGKEIDTGGSLMGLTYAILPGILSSLYFIINNNFFSLKINVTKILSLLCLFYYIGLSINYFSRGAVLAIFIYIILILIQKEEYNLSSKRMIFIFLVFILLILFTLYFNHILRSINQIINKNYIKVPFLNEMYFRSINNTQLDGRDIYYNNSIELFKKSPIFGNGTASFARYYSANYDHNIILQIMNEGGILNLIFYMIPILGSLYIIIFDYDKYNNNIKYMFVLLFCISIIRLLFSYILWREQGFWMLVILFWNRKKYYIINK